jgi:hypothetical protein
MSLKRWQVVPTADAATNDLERDVVGNKTDAAVETGTTTKSLMAYLKGVLATLGARTATAVYFPGTTVTLQAYLKGIVDLQGNVVATSTAAALTNGATIFTITGGPIVVLDIFSICIATGDGGAATLQWSATPTVGTATTISGASGSLATAVAGSTLTGILTALNTAPTLNTTGPGLISTGPSRILIPAGTIKSVVGGSASTATWIHYMRYYPCAKGVSVA